MSNIFYCKYCGKHKNIMQITMVRNTKRCQSCADAVKGKV
jgi:hypothetical protein